MAGGLLVALAVAGCGGGGGGNDPEHADSCGQVSPGSSTAVDAVFTIDQTRGDAPLVIQADASGSTSVDGTITGYRWDFGDGGTATGPTVDYTYASAGRYTLALTVTDADDGTGTAGRCVTADPRFLNVSGAITPASRMTADTDINDAGATAAFSGNNTDGSAQTLFNPGTASGFVTAVASRVSGSPLEGETDREDWYSATLRAGQEIGLSLADYRSGSSNNPALDLLLYATDDPSNPTLVDMSTGDSDTRSLSVASSGTYYIVVHAARGQSNYTLVVDDSVSQAAAPRRDRRLSDDFIAGQAIARFRSPPPGASPLTAKQQAMTVRSGDPRGLALVDMPLPVRIATAGAMQHPHYGRVPATLIDKLETLTGLRTLEARSDVAYAEPDYRLHPLRVPNDTYYPNQWHYPLINLPKAWDLTTGTGSPSVVVAVVDTGIVLSHPDLSPKLVSGYDFISDPTRAGDGDGLDNDPDDEGDGGGFGANSWHGTHVAGTIGAASNNGTGVSGVSWGARIMPVRALGIGGGSSYDILQGVRYAAGLSNDSHQQPATPADIINLSVGGSGYSRAFQQTVRDARAAGIIVVASAGNEGVSEPTYPATYEGVISVSAVGPDARRADYSNYGPGIDVAAPGGDQSLSFRDGVLSTYIDDGGGRRRPVYQYLQGTSMAAPHVSGVLALMKAVHPGLGPEEADALIDTGAITDDLGQAGRDDYYGYGLINALKAVTESTRLANGGTVPAYLVAQPNRLEFGFTASSLTLTLSAEGSGGLSVADVTENAAWLAVTPDEVDADGLGDYRVSVDRSQLALSRGNATLTIDIAGTDNDPGVAVTAGESLSDGQQSAGHIYVFLINARTGTPLSRVAEVDTAGGPATWRLEDVPAGRYFMLAGSDMDGDLTVCDAGEVCGTYPTLGSPEPVLIGQDRDNLDVLVTPARVNGFSALAPATLPDAGKADEPPALRAEWPLSGTGAPSPAR